MTIFEDAVEKWGTNSQLGMVMEECAELIQQCSKLQRGKANTLEVIEEMVDVSIMFEQMKIIMYKQCGKELFDMEFDKIKDKQLKKLREFLDK